MRHGGIVLRGLGGLGVRGERGNDRRCSKGFSVGVFDGLLCVKRYSGGARWGEFLAHRMNPFLAVPAGGLE